MEMGWCSDHGLPHSALLEWDQEDRAKLHAHLIEESTRCVMCGTKDWEWEENKFAYMAQEKTCQGCYLKHMASEEGDSLPGTTYELVVYDSALIEKQRLRYEQAIMQRHVNESGGNGQRGLRGHTHR